MTAFADLSEIVNRVTGGNSGTPQFLNVWKDNRVGSSAAANLVAQKMTSLWQYNGTPSDGAAPGGSVINPDNTTTGGIKQNDPSGGRQLWLLGAQAMSSRAGMLVLYDRLLTISGLSGTVTTAQTVGGSLTRYTDGKGNEIWAEIYTAIGATARTISASYTNTAAASGQTSRSAVFGGTGSNEAQRIIPISLASGDTGVEAVASVTIGGGSTGTAGDFGINIVHRLHSFPIHGPGGVCIRNFVTEGRIIEIPTDACLAWAFFANGVESTTAPVMMASLTLAER